MIQAIIFDCFGVLVEDGWLPFKRHYFGQDTDLFEQAGYLNNAVNAGRASYMEFISTIADLAHVSPENARQQIERNPANDQLFTYIKNELKPSYKIGMLSNAGANWLPELLGQANIDLFDEIVLSFESGLTKPDAAAYQLIANRLGIDPASCVFIDDQKRYCEAAAAEGMQALVYESFEQLQAALTKILSV